MKNFVFTTNRCKKDVAKFHCDAMVERFTAHFEKLNDVIDLSNYDRGVTPYYCKIDSGFAIVFAFEKNLVGTEEVTCFLVMRVFSCQDKDYETFKHKKTAQESRRALVGVIDSDERNVIWKEVEKRLSPEEKETTALNENERAFLYRERSIVTQMFDIPIYETPEWVSKVATSTGVSYSHIFELGSSIKDLVYEHLESENGIYTKDFYTDVNQNREFCLCAKLIWKEENGKAREGWFLIAVGAKKIIDEAKAKYAQMLDNGDYAQLSRHCKRGYPVEFLDDMDSWARMEKLPSSNLVLSEEEIKVVSTKIEFPLFLTGRAGSGKSTMLQYLFSEYLLRSVTSQIGVPPIYLSWEDELKTQAEKLASEILEKNTSFCNELLEHGLIYDRDIKPLLSKSFSTFSNLVRSCVGKNDPNCLEQRFSETDGTWIRFPEFRRMWDENCGTDPHAREEYGPELCWHVIRSYIKGWDSERFMTPDEYRCIGEDYKDVDENIFDVVYKKVWLKWYSKIGNSSQWDDLDLVRYCLHPKHLREGKPVDSTFVDEGAYSAIFCDEAQDFTRVEIEFILRLSIFTKRRLTEKDVLRLPIVFAGDEAQTLNPTGFSWNSLRSYFYDRLFSMLSLKQKDCRIPDVQTLTKNYRSTDPIVKLGNSIQLLRHVRVGSNESYEPQLPYDTAGVPKPVYSLDPADPDVWNQLKRLNALLIIPSAGVQTPKEFLEKTPVGQNHWLEFHENGDVKDLMVLNPMEAKGLEFQCVAVYGFDLAGVLPEQLKGREIADWLDNRAKTRDVVRDKIGQTIALKYFLSNAYVAATRAEKQLFVLTNGRDQDGFWSFVFSQNGKTTGGLSDKIEEHLLRSVSEAGNVDSKVDGSFMGRIVPGGIDLLESGEVVDARENCARIFKEAQSRRNPSLMRKAASGYKDLGDDIEYKRCTAYELEYKGDFESAAKLFADIGEDGKAVEDFWRALNAETIDRVLPRLIKYSPSLHYGISVARIVAKNTTTYEQVKIVFEELSRELSRKSDTFTYATLPTWSFVIGRLLQGLPEIQPQDFDHVAVVLEMAERLMSSFEMPLPLLSKMAFGILNYDYVVRLWERKKQSSWLSKEGPCEYWLSKAEAQGREYAERVCDFKRSRAVDWKQRVLDEFDRHGKSWPKGRLAIDARAVISEALLSVVGDSEAKDCVAWLLDNSAQTIEAGREWIEQLLAKSKTACSRVCVEAAVRAKLGEGLDESECRKFNESASALDLYRTLKTIAEIKGNAFWTKLATSGKETAMVAKDFISRDFRSVWFEYEVRAVGCVLEERRYYVDCCKFYEWAAKASSNPAFRRLLLARWTVNKERQIQTNGESAENPEVLRNLRALSVKTTAELPELDMGWGKFFREIFDKIPCDKESSAQLPEDEEIGNETLKEDEKIPQPVEEKPRTGQSAETPQGVQADSSIRQSEKPVDAVPDVKIDERSGESQSDSDRKVTISSADDEPNVSVANSVVEDIEETSDEVGADLSDLDHKADQGIIQDSPAGDAVLDYEDAAAPKVGYGTEVGSDENTVERSEKRAHKNDDMVASASLATVSVGNSGGSDAFDRADSDGHDSTYEDSGAECDFLSRFSEYVELCGYQFDDRDLARFHTSVKCGMMIVLGGAPGVGKSSLSELYFKFLGGGGSSPYLPVAVNSTWIEPADILGGMNLDEKFIDSTTGIAQFIRKAARDQKRIFPICFEEMNLACAEHYFSDFMRGLSNDLSAGFDICGYDKAGNPDVSAGEKELFVSENLRIVGTCNFDVTTRPFSPRFYDRCSYIELQSHMRGFPKHQPRIIDVVDADRKYCDCNYDMLHSWRIDEGVVEEQVEMRLSEILGLLEKASIVPSPRVLLRMKRYVLSRPVFGDKVDEGNVQLVALDEAVAQYVLSKFMPEMGVQISKAQLELEKYLNEHQFDISARLIRSIRSRFGEYV